MIDPQLARIVQDWIAADPDTGDRAELSRLVDAGDSTALQVRFGAPLSFGTAGLRGPLRAGPAGMNAAVIRATAAGLAAHLTAARSLEQSPDHAGPAVIVIGYDGRHRSLEFARDSAAVFAAAGLDARLLPEALPTPVLAFAVQHLRAVAGVMVTASHNPPQDNGYKVYAADGAQIVAPVDAHIQSAIAGVGPAAAIPLSAGYTVLDHSVVSDYLTAITSLLHPGGPRELRTVHTSMHGVGGKTVRSAFLQAGFAAPIEVAEQARPDPDFPTVAFPNPEEPGAMDLALALAATVQADVLIANDPDADRCAVGVAAGAAGWQMLTGDQVGWLLADWQMSKGVRGTYASTIVSSSMLSAMAARRGYAYVETLTGFKWIARAAPDLAYGYEEALGYALAPDIVRDKDGVSAALVVAEMAAAYKARGSSLLQRLDELAVEFGRYITRQVSWRVTELTEISAAMARLRGNLPKNLLGEPITATDLLPDNDVLILRGGSARAVIRPSGTEPKLKMYLEVVRAAGDLGGGEQALAQLGSDLAAVLGLSIAG